MKQKIFFSIILFTVFKFNLSVISSLLNKFQNEDYSKIKKVDCKLFGITLFKLLILFNNDIKPQ